MKKRKECKWLIYKPENPAYFHTSCGDMFVLAGTSLEQQGFKYCMYCGKKISTYFNKIKERTP